MIHHSRLKLLQEIPEGRMFDEMVSHFHSFLEGATVHPWKEGGDLCQRAGIAQKNRTRKNRLNCPIPPTGSGGGVKACEGRKHFMKIFQCMTRGAVERNPRGGQGIGPAVFFNQDQRAFRRGFRRLAQFLPGLGRLKLKWKFENMSAVPGPGAVSAETMVKENIISGRRRKQRIFLEGATRLDRVVGP